MSDYEDNEINGSDSGGNEEMDSGYESEEEEKNERDDES